MQGVLLSFPVTPREIWPNPERAVDETSADLLDLELSVEIDDAQLGHRKRFASEIERGVRQPGDGENLHAPTLDATRLDIHCGSDLR